MLGTRRLPGEHRVQILAGEQVLSDDVVVTPANGDTVIHNALGLGTIVRATAVYSSGNDKGSGPEPTLLPFTRMALTEDVDYPFSEPPKSISSKESGRISRTLLALLPGDPAVPLFQTLAAHRDPARAIQLAEVRLGLPGASELDAHRLSIVAAMASGRDAEVGVLLRALGRNGKSAPFLRSFAHETVHKDRAEYGNRVLKALETTGTSPQLSIAALRGLPEAEVLRRLDVLGRTDPKDPNVRAMQARRMIHDHRYTECVDLTADMVDVAYVEVRATCLFGAGRAADALALLDPIASGETDYAPSIAVLYATISSAAARKMAGLWATSKGALPLQKPTAGATPARTTAAFVALETDGFVAAAKHMKALEPHSQKDGPSRAPSGRDILALRIGETDRVGSPGEGFKSFKNATAVAEAAGRSPSEEQRLYQPDTFGPAQHYLPQELTLLLALEDLRGGNDARGRERAVHLDQSVPFDVISGFVLDGGDRELLWSLPEEELAGVLFIRSRRLLTLGRERDAEEMLRDAFKADVFSGWVTKLAHSWPSPVRTEERLSVARLVR